MILMKKLVLVVSEAFHHIFVFDEVVEAASVYSVLFVKALSRVNIFAD
jgi:hypothetical protein